MIVASGLRKACWDSRIHPATSLTDVEPWPLAFIRYTGWRNCGLGNSCCEWFEDRSALLELSSVFSAFGSVERGWRCSGLEVILSGGKAEEEKGKENEENHLDCRQVS